MRRFRFRLAPVLRVRRHEEERARAALTTATLALRRAQDELAERSAAYATSTPAPPPGPASAVQRAHDRRGSLAAAVLQQQLVVAQAQDAVDEARTAWRAAAARVGALERLEERHRAEHRAALLAAQDAAPDEVVVSARARSAW